MLDIFSSVAGGLYNLCCT